MLAPLLAQGVAGWGRKGFHRREKRFCSRLATAQPGFLPCRQSMRGVRQAVCGLRTWFEGNLRVPVLGSLRSMVLIKQRGLTKPGLGRLRGAGAWVSDELIARAIALARGS